MKKKSLFLLPVLLLSNISSALIHERSWVFENNEVVHYNFKNDNTGINVGCDKFDNGYVSFEIKFKGQTLIANKKSYENNNTDENGFSTITLKDISLLDLVLPAGGEYDIKNITGKKVTSSFCDVGII